jgi:hypothetical protein
MPVDEPSPDAIQEVEGDRINDVENRMLRERKEKKKKHKKRKRKHKKKKHHSKEGEKED